MYALFQDENSIVVLLLSLFASKLQIFIYSTSFDLFLHHVTIINDVLAVDRMVEDNLYWKISSLLVDQILNSCKHLVRAYENPHTSFIEVTAQFWG